MMLTWVPACLAFYQRYCQGTCCCCLLKHAASDSTQLDTCRIGQILCSWRSAANRSLRGFFELRLPRLVLAPRYLWLLGLGGLMAASGVALFYLSRIHI